MHVKIRSRGVMCICVVCWCAVLDITSFTSVITSSIGLLVYKAATSSVATVVSTEIVWFQLMPSIILRRCVVSSK